MRNLTIKRTNSTVEVAESRRYGKRRRQAVIAVALAVVLAAGAILSGCFFDQFGKAEDKTFTSKGMSITLNDSFTEADASAEGKDICYESKTVIVIAEKAEFALGESSEDATVDEYLETVIETNGKESEKIKSEDGVKGVEYDYTDPDTNEVIHYFSYAYRADDAYWLVSFAVNSKNTEKLREQIGKWADTVEFEHVETTAKPIEDEPTQPKDFSVEGMTITLTEDFVENADDAFVATYASTDILVFVTKHTFSAANGFEYMTVEQYIDATVSSDIDFDYSKTDGTDGLQGFEYTFTKGVLSFKYSSYVFKTDDAIWIIQFATDSKKHEDLKPAIAEYAKTVKFEKTETAASDANAGNNNVFSVDGMNITLTDSFAEENIEGFNAAYFSDTMFVFVLKEDFSLLEGSEDLTVDEYIDLVIENNTKNVYTKNNSNGLHGLEYEYTDPSSGSTYYYFDFAYKSTDAFWTVNFAVSSENAESFKGQIVKFAQSVEFTY